MNGQIGEQEGFVFGDLAHALSHAEETQPTSASTDSDETAEERTSDMLEDESEVAHFTCIAEHVSIG